MNEASSFVMTALKSFAEKNDNKSCQRSSEITCRWNRMIDTIDKNYPYKR